MKNKQELQDYTQNRELSLMSYNRRILENAQEQRFDPAQRLRFMEIFSHNMDEFFRVRVGKLAEYVRSGKEHEDCFTGSSAREQLQMVGLAAGADFLRRDNIWDELAVQFSGLGMEFVRTAEWTAEDRESIGCYVRSEWLPCLCPLYLNSLRPFPYLKSGEPALIVCWQEGGSEKRGIVTLPGNVPWIISLSGESKQAEGKNHCGGKSLSAAKIRFALTEDILLEYASVIFGIKEITEKAIILPIRCGVSVGKADWSGKDYRQGIGEMLDRQQQMPPVRLDVRGELSQESFHYLDKSMGLYGVQKINCRLIKPCGSLPSSCLQFCRGTGTGEGTGTDAGGLEEGRNLYKFHSSTSITEAVRKQDCLLHYPYDSFGPFLRALEEAAEDPEVLSVRTTIYRLAEASSLVRLLCLAAQNGKEVLVLIELKARSEERKNMAWAEKLEHAGCRLLYGFQSKKVHAKLCLITRRRKQELEYMTLFSTGNFNEATACQYGDLALLTVSSAIGRDAAAFFCNMAAGRAKGNYECLLAAPHGLRAALLHLIEEEKAKAGRGEKAYILWKLNALADPECIQKLKEAACAGVRVELIIRGICCILPGIAGKTEHIAVKSIVGRYLEHARVYCFGYGKEKKLYLSSADLMKRNLDHRIELACPVLDPALWKKIVCILQCQWKDTVNASQLQPDGSYLRCLPERDAKAFDSQEYFMNKTNC